MSFLCPTSVLDIVVQGKRRKSRKIGKFPRAGLQDILTSISLLWDTLPNDEQVDEKSLTLYTCPTALEFGASSELRKQKKKFMRVEGAHGTKVKGPGLGDTDTGVLVYVREPHLRTTDDLSRAEHDFFFFFFYFPVPRGRRRRSLHRFIRVGLGVNA